LPTRLDSHVRDLGAAAEMTVNKELRIGF